MEVTLSKKEVGRTKSVTQVEMSLSKKDGWAERKASPPSGGEAFEEGAGRNEKRHLQMEVTLWKSRRTKINLVATLCIG